MRLDSFIGSIAGPAHKTYQLTFVHLFYGGYVPIYKMAIECLKTVGMVYHNVSSVSGGDVAAECNAALRGINRCACRGLYIYTGMGSAVTPLCPKLAIPHR